MFQFIAISAVLLECQYYLMLLYVHFLCEILVQLFTIFCDYFCFSTQFVDPGQCVHLHL